MKIDKKEILNSHSMLNPFECPTLRTIYGIKICGVYSYIGETNNFERRKKEHLNALKQSKHVNKKLQSRYNMSPNKNDIEVIPIIELKSDNIFLGYLVEGLVISWLQDSICNDVVIKASYNSSIKLPYLPKNLAMRILLTIADYYMIDINL